MPMPELTDAGNARRFAAQYGAGLRYSHDWKRWYVWDYQRWAPDSSGAVARAVKDFVRGEKRAAGIALAEAGAGTNEERVARSWMEHAIRSQSRRALMAIEDLARSEEPIPISVTAFDRPAWLLNCANGTLDLRTGVLRPYDPADHITKLLPTNNAGATCPRWERFLFEIMGEDTSLVDYLQRAVGWTLTGDISEQAMFFLHGLGANGKSTFISLLRALLGEYAVDTESKHLPPARPQRSGRRPGAPSWGAVSQLR
jgi:putative DNA primase/helicase